MAGNPNADMAKRFFDAVAAADLATIQSLLADDAVLTLPGSFSRAGVFKGRDEFLRGVGQLVEASGGTLRVELLSTFVNGADGDQVIPRHWHREGRAARRAERLSDDLCQRPNRLACRLLRRP
jgi:ketosteroid isomerase-like protein